MDRWYVTVDGRDIHPTPYTRLLAKVVRDRLREERPTSNISIRPA